MTTINALKARAREDIDSGEEMLGDDRPPVYPWGGVWVYRVSGVSTQCDKALWLARKGVDKDPLNPKVAEGMRGGRINEELILAMFEAQSHNTVVDRQATGKIDIMDGVEIRGSIDGRTGRQIIDAKKLGPDLWKNRARILDIIPGWGVQMDLYLTMHGLDEGLFVYGQAVDGVVENIDHHVHVRRPQVVAKVKARVRRLEGMVVNKETPECPDEKFMCSYWTHHVAEKPKPVKVKDKEANRLARAITAAQVKKADAEKAEREARDKLWAISQEQGWKGTVEVGARVVTVVEPSVTRQWDADKLKAHLGDRADEFRKDREVKGSLRFEKKEP